MGWTKADVVNEFYNLDRICYSKDLKIYEETYEELKDKLDLIREERGRDVIVRPRRTKWQIIKEALDKEKEEFEKNERKKMEENKNGE